MGRIAGLLVGLEGIGLIALTIWQVVALVAGDTAALDSGLALIVLTAIGAAIVLAFAVAILRGMSWGRSGGIVVQVLIVAVAIGAATGAYAHPVAALALAAPAALTLALLVLTAREAGRAASGPAASGPAD
ncbi:MAG: histidine kinase [Microbacterium sp.]